MGRAVGHFVICKPTYSNFVIFVSDTAASCVAMRYVNDAVIMSVFNVCVDERQRTSTSGACVNADTDPCSQMGEGALGPPPVNFNDNVLRRVGP